MVSPFPAPGEPTPDTEVLRLVHEVRRRYQTEDISLARAAHLAGISYDRIKALLVERGVQLRLGPADERDALQEIEDMGRVISERMP